MRREAAGWLVAIALGAALTAAVVQWSPALVQSLRYTRTLGGAAPFAFIAIHTLGVVAFVPATVFAVAGGALFGFARGTLYSIVGGGLGALVAFLLGRYVIRHLFGPRFTERPQFAAVDRAVASNAVRILCLLRLSPIMPFNVLNYALGMSTVGLRDFTISLIGMLPGTLAAAYAGEVMGVALALAGKTGPARNSSYYLLLVVGLLATIVAVAVLTKTARKALRNMA